MSDRRRPVNLVELIAPNKEAKRDNEHNCANFQACLLN